MRLIDTDKLKFPNIAVFDMKLHGTMVPMVRLIDLRELMPTVDAAPVKHGRWKAAKAGGPNYPFWDSRCSECGYTTSMVIRNWNYCPACGAKMDLEETKNDAE